MDIAKRTCRAVAVASALVWAGTEAAAAQTAGAVPTGPPPSWESLIPCAGKADPVEGFRCYQAAMRAAGYAADPEIVAAERRRRFGLPLPSFGHRPSARPAPADTSGAQVPGPAAVAEGEEESQDRETFVLDQVALIPPLNRLLMVTKEGVVWQQTDSEVIAPRPRPGQTMTVVRSSISGFFCQFDKRNKVRCIRTH